MHRIHYLSGIASPTMPQAHFSLSISKDEYLRYYQGSANAVIVRARDGKRVSFPASALRLFVGHDGVSGEFVLTYDDNNRFVDLKKVAG